MEFPKDEVKNKIVWTKGADFTDGSPRYTFEGRDPATTYERFQVVIYTERELRYAHDPGSLCNHYYGYVRDDKMECAETIGPYYSVREAKWRTLELFNSFVQQYAAQELDSTTPESADYGHDDQQEHLQYQWAGGTPQRKYTRALKELGIAVIFEKENINSLEEDSELRITLSGAFAQSESESISANVTWGKRRAMESGKAAIQYKYLYGYRRGADDKPEIIPEEAEVVRWIYERYLAGASTRMLRDELHEQGVIYSEKSPQWTLPHIKSILRNEKYCGDVLMQKTFQQDVINRRVIKNTGQLPMYLIENHHEGIVSREKYNAVQAEMARRKAAKSPSKRASTGLSAYTSRYALSDRLVCGECGTLYRRCTWTRPDGKRVVWRCVSRLDYGKKYCHSSPTLDEVPLQQAIIAALNTVLPDLDGRIRQITEALEAEVIPFPGSGMSLGDIDRRLTELEAQFQRLLEKAADDPIAYGNQFKEILDEQTALKELRATILAENKKHAEADRRIRDAAGMLENAVPHIAEWDESAIRQLVAQVKVLSKNEISVTLKSGIEIRQSISN